MTREELGTMTKEQINVAMQDNFRSGGYSAATIRKMKKDTLIDEYLVLQEAQLKKKSSPKKSESKVNFNDLLGITRLALENKFPNSTIIDLMVGGIVIGYKVHIPINELDFNKKLKFRVEPKKRNNKIIVWHGSTKYSLKQLDELDNIVASL